MYDVYVMVLNCGQNYEFLGTPSIGTHDHIYQEPQQQRLMQFKLAVFPTRQEDIDLDTNL